MPDSDLNKALILREADRCVKCALCLPHCPTYRLFGNEGDSPRGRIALMHASVLGDLPDSPALKRHLEGCLMCRACERACPSGVSYGRLMDASRAVRRGNLGFIQRGWRRFLLGLVSRQRNLVLLGWIIKLYQGCALASWMRRILPRRLARLTMMLPEVSALEWLKQSQPAGQNKMMQVALFTGCVSRVVEQDVLVSAVRVLNHLGCGVTIPEQQHCCGAMHRHAGEAVMADNLVARNQKLFADDALSAVVTIATGCGAELIEHGDFKPPVLDINRLLEQLTWPGSVRFHPLAKKVMLHEPCSLRYGGYDPGTIPLLLQKIPQLDLQSLPGNSWCCGAAGSYMLTQPDNADNLLQPKIESIKAEQPDIVITSNTGCAMHLRAGIRRAGLDVEVLHPVQLLARQLIVEG